MGIMESKIFESINDADKLEKLYRENRKSFESEFEKVYPEIRDTEAAKFWKSRLDYEKPISINGIFGADFYVMIIICVAAGILIKIPEIFGFDAMRSDFYFRNTALIMFLGLSVFAITNNKGLSTKNIAITLLIFLFSGIFINLLPLAGSSASVKLVYIHMPLLVWFVYGLVYTGFDTGAMNKRIEYIKYNGDLAIMSGLIVIAGGALMAISVTLFQAIGIQIGKFYTTYIVQIGFVSAPIVATFILKNYSSLSNKIAPIIANLFSPLVMVTLIIYLAAMAVIGKDPYNDRDFLLIFNILLIGVMALIIFSVSETSLIRKQRFNELILFILSVVTLIVNLVALSAIFYRLSEFGFTPNRVAILGSNIVIFINLILITIDLFKINFRKSEIDLVENTIARYLPVYIGWIVFVVFILPFIFGLR
jgi:hypothetical protein